MSQTVSEKRTVITTSSGGSGYDSLEDIPYKANFGSRSSNVMSRSSLPMRSSTGGSMITRTVEYGYGSHMGGGMGPGGYSSVSNTGVTSVKTHREKEKKDLQDLNERFASYIEKVRFLEAQNRKLGTELDELRSKWGKETSQIKQMYEAELAEARRLIDDLSKDKAALEIKASSMQEQFGDMQRQLDEAKKYRQVDREQIAKLNQQLADCESEINMLRRSIESLETERSRDKGTINRLQQEVDKLRIDLNNETLAHLDAENRRQTLEEEMEFMKKVHEQELKELAALAYRDTTAENREFWKSELGQAIRDIQQEYDAKVEQLRGDMEGFYNLKIQEYRTGATKQNMEVTHVREENKKLTKQMSDFRSKLADLEARNAQLEKQYQEALREIESKENDHMLETTQLREEILKLRNEMEGILTELQTLMDAKLSLELEISAYRKLLEGEENRVDWRSRASLIMYRDAFKPSSTDRSKAESTKEIETERPIEAKTEKTVSRQPEQREASPDTDAASSITMSDNDMSVKGDEGDLELEESGGKTVVDTQKVESETVVDLDNTGIGTGSGSVDSVKSPVMEHVVKVKEQVQKIETQNINDETDSMLNEKENDSAIIDAETDTQKTKIEQETELIINEQAVKEKEDRKSPSPVEETINLVATTTVESASEPKPKSPLQTESENGGSEIQLEKSQSPEVDSTQLVEEIILQENNKEVSSTGKDSSKSPSKSEERNDHIVEQVTGVKDVTSSLKEERQTSDLEKSTDESEERLTTVSNKDIDEKDTSIQNADKNMQKDKVNENDLLNGNIKYSEISKSEKSPTEQSKPDSSKDESISIEQEEKKASTMETIQNESTNNEEIKKEESEIQIKQDDSAVVDSEVQMDSKQNESDTKEQNIKDEESIVESKHETVSVEQISEKTIKPDVQPDEHTENTQPEAESTQQTIEEDIKVNSEQDHLTEVEQTIEEHSKVDTTLDEIIEVEQSIKEDRKDSNGQDQILTEDQKDKNKLEGGDDQTLNLESSVSEKSNDTQSKNEETTSGLATSNIESKVVSMGEYMEQKTESKISSGIIHEENDTQKKDLDEEFDNTVKEAEQKPRSPSPKRDEKDIKTTLSIDESKSQQKSINMDLTNEVNESNEKSLYISKEHVTGDHTRDKSPEGGVKTAENEENKQVALTGELSERVEITSSSKVESNIVSLSEYTEKTKERTNSETVSEHISITTKEESKQESIEKTEDKILESVVRSKIIEKSPQESARIEMSPTKELPESFPDTKSADKTQMLSDEPALASSDSASSVSEKPIPENIHESHTSEQIEDDKTPEDEEATVGRNDIQPSDPLTGIKGKNGDISKIDETQKPSSTVDVQHVESTSNDGKTSEKDETKDTSVLSDKEDEITETKYLSKEQDIMTQSFIAENGLLANGDIKNSDSETHTSTEKIVSEADTLQKLTSDKQDNAKEKKTDDQPKNKPEDHTQKPDTVLQEKIENLLLNGQGEQTSQQSSESIQQSITTSSTKTSSETDSQVSMKMMRGEVSAKTTYQRTSTGPIAISEVSPEAKYITLENTSSGPNKKDVNLDGWQLKRVIDGGSRPCVYNFRNFTLKAGKKVKIMARGCASEAGLNDLVFRDSADWGTGQHVVTSLINDKEEEKASHVQKTNYN